MWWHGPSWLQVEDCRWPVWSFSDVTPEVLTQVKSEAKGPSLIEVSNVAVVDQNEAISPCDINEKCFSSLRKLLRVTVFVMRFIKRMVWDRIKEEKHCKWKLLTTVFDILRDREPITCQEIKTVSLLWVSFVQHKNLVMSILLLRIKRRIA